MPTSVRVDGPTKVELDRLQGHIQAETGQRMSHSALLARLLRFARRNEGRFLRDIETVQVARPTRPGLKRLLVGTEDSSVVTDASKIDEVLYGDDAQ